MLGKLRMSGGGGRGEGRGGVLFRVGIDKYVVLFLDL